MAVTFRPPRRSAPATVSRESDVLDALARLADKSLVQVESTPSGARYRCLAPIRQYARERLIDSGEEHRRARSASAVLGSSRARCGRPTAQQSTANWSDSQRCLRRLEDERDNIRAALRWAIASAQIELGLQVAAALSTPSYVWGLYAECRQLLVDLLDTPGAQDLPSAAVALGSAGGLAFYQDDYSTAQRLLEQSRARWVGQADVERLPDTLNSLSMTVLRYGDKLGARRLLDEARALELEHGLRFSEAMTLGNLATVEYADNDYASRDAAPRGVVRDLAQHRQPLWPGAGPDRVWVSSPTRGATRQPRARFFEESLGVLHDVDAPPQRARALAGTRPGGAERGRHAGGARTLRGKPAAVACSPVSDSASRAASPRWQPWPRSSSGQSTPCGWSVRRAPSAGTLGVQEAVGGSGLLERAIEDARRKVGTHAAEALMRQGEAMDLDQAVAIALADEQPAPAPSAAAAANPLSRREREVAVLLAEGLSNRQIAERLVIAEKTAALHVEHILAKLGLHSRWQAADWVRQAARARDYVNSIVSATWLPGSGIGSYPMEVRT